MAYSSVSICSNALLKVGAAPISALDGSSDSARICSNLYPQVVDTMLRAHTWNCAIKRVVLSPSATSPEWKYANKFNLPGDWLRTISIGDNDYSPDYQQEERTINCDESAIYLRYVFRNDSPSTWDVLLIDAVTAAMAAELAYPLTKSTSLMQAKQQELEYIIRRARNVDAQENPPIQIIGSELLNARFQGSRYA